MNETDIPDDPVTARIIDQICDQFEAACKSGRKPQPEQYLRNVSDSVRPALMRQLTLLGQEYSKPTNGTSAGNQTVFYGDTELKEANDAPAENGRASTPLNLDKRLERYQSLQEVGSGGIGVVYRAHDRVLGRELAVKLLRREYQDNSEARQRFVEEARIGSQLQHPAIVPVYEIDLADERQPYFTMKLVNGQTLAELLRKRDDSRSDLPQLLNIFEQVCQAMAYAHSRGVIHRDLKPANIMVGAFGEVQVMDWGFAKQLRIADYGLRIESDSHHGAGFADVGISGIPHPQTTIHQPPSTIPHPPITNGVSQSGMLMGTPAYMPPEQARGHMSLIDQRTDVFALGAILCEILTGQAPYSGSTADEVCRAAAGAKLSDAMARLDSCAADESLRNLSKRCLAEEQKNRPADAGVLAAELTAYLATSQERLRAAQLDRAAAEARAKSERRARRVTVALAGALFMGAGIATWQAVAATQAKENAAQKEAESTAVLKFVRDNVFGAGRGRETKGLDPNVTLADALTAALPNIKVEFADQPLMEARVRKMLAGSLVSSNDENALAAAEQFQMARAIFSRHNEVSEAEYCVCAMADCYANAGRHQEAIPLLQSVLADRKARLGPGHRDTRWTMWGLANSLYAVGRGIEATAIVDEYVNGIVGTPAALGHPIWAMMNIRLRFFEKNRDGAGCRATAEAWESLQRKDAASLNTAACYRAVTSKIVRGSNERAADAESDRAMDWLKSAVGAGYNDADTIEKNADMDDLRIRPDFQELIASLRHGH